MIYFDLFCVLRKDSLLESTSVQCFVIYSYLACMLKKYLDEVYETVQIWFLLIKRKS